MKNVSLYNISNRFVELFNRDDLTEEEFKEQGEELGKLLQNKSESIVAVDIDLTSTIEKIDKEISRLKVLKENVVTKEEKLKEYVKSNMEMLGLEKIDTALGTISIRKNPPKVDVFDESQIEDRYYTIKTTRALSKTKIKEELEKGNKVNGARIISETSLQIK